jgi:hypothetical protein
MALMRDMNIVQIVDRLELALPGKKPVAASTVAEARERLGKAPLEWLFVTTANRWAHESARQHQWRGLAVYGVDGTSLRVADSEKNRIHFGGTQGPRGASGYPMLRMVALMALRSHLLAAVQLGPYQGTHEIHFASELWSSVPPSSLVVIDKAFLGANILVPLQTEGRHWLTRAKVNTKFRQLKRLGSGDFLVEMDISSKARKEMPQLGRTWLARAIQYQRKGFRPQLLLTSLTDAEQYPRNELVELYHERWEIELGYDELKTEMLESEECLRSTTPERVNQEVLGLLLAYNLVRLEMTRIADIAGVPPIRISFVATMEVLVTEWFWFATMAAGAIPKRIHTIEAKLIRLLLPERRRERTYPRQVKIKMSSYDRKRPGPRKAPAATSKSP